MATALVVQEALHAFLVERLGDQVKGSARVAVLTGCRDYGHTIHIPGPAVLANAIEDALTPAGVVIDEAPITPNRLRELLRRSAGR
jgi:hypothetical protein